MATPLSPQDSTLLSLIALDPSSEAARKLQRNLQSPEAQRIAETLLNETSGTGAHTDLVETLRTWSQTWGGK